MLEVQAQDFGHYQGKVFLNNFIIYTKGDKFSLLQLKLKIIENLENLSKPIIICNEEHRFIVGDEMRKIKINPLTIILETFGRNTAPFIAIADLKAVECFKGKDIEPILLILSSSHHI